MKLVASADLGGLGAPEGPPVMYHWTRSNPLPALLPWLGILGLLLLPRNRTGQAWWIWAPLVVLVGLRGIPTVLTSATQLPSGVVDLLLPPAAALSFGLAAVWLVLPWASHGHRFVNGLCFGGILLLGSALVLMLQLIGNDDYAMDLVQWGVVGGISIFVITLALYLAGWLCRKRCGQGRFALMAGLSLMGTVLLVLMPFFVVMLLASGGAQALQQILISWALVVGFSGVMVGPFLVLSWGNAFFRQRLEEALRVGAQAQPLQFPAPPLVVEQGTGVRPTSS